MPPKDTKDFHENLPTEQDVLNALKKSEKKEDIFLHYKDGHESKTSSKSTTRKHKQITKKNNLNDIPVIAPEESQPQKKSGHKNQAKKTINHNKTKAYKDYSLPTSASRKKIMKDKTVKLQARSSASKALEKKLALVKTLIVDVDGVLTDGSIYITDQGTGFKSFYSQDGLGMTMLMSNGIQVVLLSARQCKATRKRARELDIANINLGVKDKKYFLLDYMKKNKLLSYEVAYIGDDLIDFPAMLECGVKIMPANGIEPMAKAMDYTTHAFGGKGAVREVCDMILMAKGLYQQYLDY